MPVPRVFEAPSDPRAQWAHLVASLLALVGPEHRTAFLADLVGEELPGVGTAQVREFRPVGDEVVDIVLHDADKSWVVGIQTTLAFDADDAGRLGAAHDALSGIAARTILLAITPDRAEPAAVVAARTGGRDIRHQRWQRVRDWVQERPERGNAHGPDHLLLREADYVLNARTAELYRLEELMPLIREPARAALATAYFDLDDVHTAPRITQSDGVWTIAAPRTGDALAEIVLGGGTLAVALKEDAPGPGFAADARGGWQRLQIASAADYQSARGHVQAALRRLLPPKR